MQRISLWVLLITIFLLAAADCFAGQIKAYVAPFAVTGTANREELKGILQNLLMSRLSNESIIAVDSAEQADISITGSYIAFGKVFSIDTAAKSSTGKVLVRAFEQGESQEEVLQIVGKLAKALQSGIDKHYVRSETLQAPVAAVSKVETVAPRAEAVVRNVETVSPPSDIIRSETMKSTTTSGWMSQKLEGELTGVALGGKLSTGEREVFVTGIHSLKYFRLGKELLLVAEVTLPLHQKVLTVDAADLDGDGITEIYLTIISGDDLASEVWTPDGNSLKKIGDKLPYFFRGITLRGENAKIYAQQLGRDDDYYGDLYEVTKAGSVFGTKNPLKLPRGANLFNSSIFLNKEGKVCFVVLNPDGFLLVYDESGKRLWKSSDKYGGSENFFDRDDLKDMKVTGTSRRKIFLEQRLTVTKNGTIIVPKNDGFFVIGYNRAYTKNSVYAFAWNGVMLDELWHTKQSQNYLSDYQYNEEQKELLLLEVVLKDGILEKGKSALSIKRVE